MRRVWQLPENAADLISGNARFCKKNAGARIHPPQRDKKPRQPPAWAFAGPTCSANSSLAGSSSIPGSSGGLIMGITAGMLCGALLSMLLGISWRVRNSGAAVTVEDSVRGGGGAAVAAGAGSTAAGATGELSCAADGAVTSAGGSRGGSTRRDGARIACSNGEDWIAAFLSDGNAASGVCHLKASSRPVTGDTGRQRSLTYPSAVHTGSCRARSTRKVQARAGPASPGLVAP